MVKEVNTGTSRKRHSQQYKTEALALAEKVGVPTAAKQLGLNESQLYSWRVKNRLNQERSVVEERLAVVIATKTGIIATSFSVFGGRGQKGALRRHILSKHLQYGLSS